MKCLSLWQPWASLLVHGAKKVETRGWALGHRGPLLIHAAKKWDAEIRAICQQEPFRSVLEMESFGAAVDCGLPLGMIVGRVNVVACDPTGRVLAAPDDFPVPVPTFDESAISIGPTERAFGDYSDGRFAFLCADFTAFEKPIPYRGAQGLFDVPDEVLAKAGVR